MLLFLGTKSKSDNFVNENIQCNLTQIIYQILMDQISNTHTESVLMWVYIKKQFDLNLI